MRTACFRSAYLRDKVLDQLNKQTRMFLTPMTTLGVITEIICFRKVTTELALTAANNFK